ncbi:Ankyrin repeat-containing domain [Pseudocohnilembus persalinus]|uniref:Ankyrin repeat-containing domain n=1 Tax=Pseudocohnilembus persalinus TaxID=266149 RepID=A0A0V0QKD8_PSEPJ|nr:Ankyrin repeat-containing domain [Pseudocohnilembus persalinus]|eukprot:KRX02679.1 Ankyrin repeat-containing domain [Pseudocohnilembus persalinus]
MGIDSNKNMNKKVQDFSKFLPKKNNNQLSNFKVQKCNKENKYNMNNILKNNQHVKQLNSKTNGKICNQNIIAQTCSLLENSESDIQITDYEEDNPVSKNGNLRNEKQNNQMNKYQNHKRTSTLVQHDSYICEDKIVQQKFNQNLDYKGKKINFLELDFNTRMHLDLISSLDISDNNFSNFPEQILQLNNLKSLRLDSNKISFLPKQLCELQDLKLLSVFDNNISFLPENIEKLQSLEVLNIARNKLDPFPRQICQLKKLKTLYVFGNEFQFIPNEFQNLSNLKEFSLAWFRHCQPPINAFCQDQIIFSKYPQKSYQIADLLVKLPQLDFNLKNYEGWTPLHIAVQYNQLSAIKWALTKKFIFDFEAKGGKEDLTILQLACIYKRADIIQLLGDKNNISQSCVLELNNQNLSCSQFTQQTPIINKLIRKMEKNYLKNKIDQQIQYNVNEKQDLVLNLNNYQGQFSQQPDIFPKQNINEINIKESTNFKQKIQQNESFFSALRKNNSSKKVDNNLSQQNLLSFRDFEKKINQMVSDKKQQKNRSNQKYINENQLSLQRNSYNNIIDKKQMVQFFDVHQEEQQNLINNGAEQSDSSMEMSIIEQESSTAQPQQQICSLQNLKNKSLTHRPQQIE